MEAVDKLRSIICSLFRGRPASVFDAMLFKESTKTKRRSVFSVGRATIYGKPFLC